MDIICNLCEHESVCKHKENVELLVEDINNNMNTISEFHELINMITLNLNCSSYIKKGMSYLRKGEN